MNAAAAIFVFAVVILMSVLALTGKPVQAELDKIQEEDAK